MTCSPTTLSHQWYLRWPALPLWGSLSPLLSHWRWPHDVPGPPGTAGYSGTQKPWEEGQKEQWEDFSTFRTWINTVSRRGTVSVWCWADDRPANQTEPGEAVIKGVASSQSMVAVLHSTAGELCSTVVHFSHQVQPLSVGDGTKRKINSSGQQEEKEIERDRRKHRLNQLWMTHS